MYVLRTQFVRVYHQAVCHMVNFLLRPASPKACGPGSNTEWEKTFHRQLHFAELAKLNNHRNHTQHRGSGAALLAG